MVERVSQLADSLRIKKIGRTGHLGPDLGSDIEGAEEDGKTLTPATTRQASDILVKRLRDV
jgi:hypothetical protein